MHRVRLATHLIAVALACGPAAAIQAQQARLVIQDSPLAGFRFHEAPAVFEQMREGDTLELVREPDNPHDRFAIRVDWRGHRLGYVPRRENRALAWALDQGERIRARVSRLVLHPNPRERVRFEVLAE